MDWICQQCQTGTVWKHVTTQEKNSKPSWKSSCRNMMQLNKYKCQRQHLSRKITIAQLQDWEQMNKHQVYRKGAGDQSKSQTEHASTMSHHCEKGCSTERCVNRTVISRTRKNSSSLILVKPHLYVQIWPLRFKKNFFEKFLQKTSSRRQYKEDGKFSPF